MIWPVVGLDEITDHRRVVVVGSDADLAAVLTRLLRADRLDVEVAPRRVDRGTRAGLATASRDRVPLIRDETGTVIVGAAPNGAAIPSTAKRSSTTPCCSTAR